MSEIKTEREKFVDVVLSCVGLPYRWGSAGPDSFDCSGLVEYAFNRIGIPQGDINSAMIYSKFHNKKVLPTAAKIGSLFLYSSTKQMSNIDHVMVLVRDCGNGYRALVGSRGGDSSTKNLSDAYNRNAFVDVVTAEYWKSNLMIVVDPFL